MPFPQAGAVNTSTANGVTAFMLAKMATQQTTNIAAGDHLKLDTVVAFRGVDIALDTTTAYVNTTGNVASIGRFTLKANKTYYMKVQVPYFLGSGATGLIDLVFYDNTLAANVPGSFLTALVATTATNDVGGGGATAVFTPGQDTLVEVRIITATAVTQIGHTTNRHPTVWIETL